MKRPRFSDEQIAYALRQAEGGTAVADLSRQMGISDAAFYVWKKKYGSLGRRSYGSCGCCARRTPSSSAW